MINIIIILILSTIFVLMMIIFTRTYIVGKSLINIMDDTFPDDEDLNLLTDSTRGLILQLIRDIDNNMISLKHNHNIIPIVYFIDVILLLYFNNVDNIWIVMSFVTAIPIVKFINIFLKQIAIEKSFRLIKKQITPLGK